MGGASIFVWLIMIFAQFFRSEVPIVEQRFFQLGAAFSTLALICNHPHFIISYHFAYGRGLKFVFQNWVRLVFVPIAILFFYILAFFIFNGPVGDVVIFDSLTRCLGAFGIGFDFSVPPNWGSEILGLSIWLMYLTVGWHYSKQVYGCMMVYAKFNNYELNPRQRRLLKASVFSVAFYQFAVLAELLGGYGRSQFNGLAISALELPPIFKTLLFSMVLILFLAVIFFIFYRKYQVSRQWPSLNFLISWLAFFVWWVPVTDQKEYYIMMVPFFHGLQYLPFAFRMEQSAIRKKSRWPYNKVTIYAVITLLAGYLAFELVPYYLDNKFDTAHFQTSNFFLIAFLVFINVHHFFIDSVVWKFNQPEIKAAFFSEMN